jgi:flagellar biosynthesis/type III secretory pathway chaperone
MDKLSQVQADLKNQLKAQRLKNNQLTELLEKSRDKLQLLASNRQMYQEVDMKDAALATARKEGDDCRDRDQRLRKSIEGLRRAAPRFLQKVNKGLIPDGGKPVTVDQVQ